MSEFEELLYRKTRALEKLNSELERRVAERTSALEATAAALQEADRRKDEFLAMLAHELRNPLAPIRTAVQVLRLKELGEAQQMRARAVIDRQVDQLVRLIDDLLDASRVTRGLITLHREPTLIAAIVARAVETAKPAIDASRHELLVDLPEELLTVDCDKTRLVQVVANVLHNAAKFTDPGGCIRLKVARDGPQVVIEILDNGIGISPEVVPRIFDLFTQVHSKAEGAQTGLGIGLALVRRLTEMHGGTVAAHSTGAGRGTTIEIRLPVAESLPVVTSTELTETPLSPATELRRVLVADDNRDAAESMSLLLQLAGHEVRTAHNGREALEIADAFEPDVVLLDLGMPKMGGCEAAKRMRLRPWGRHATLVALTGWGQQRDRQRTRDAGFDAHFVKPVAESDLFRLLASPVRRTPNGVTTS